MNVYDVGVENLPNVYIDKISLSLDYAFFTKQYTINITCLLKDHDGENQQTWFNRPEMRDMEVKVAILYGGPNGRHVPIVNGLNNGIKSLYDYAVTNETQNYIEVQSRPAWQFTQFSIGDPTIISPNQHSGFGFSSRFQHILTDIVGSQPQSIYVYAACYFPPIGFGVDVFDKYYGPMSSEIVMLNDEIQENSGYFYFPETISDPSVANKEYGGPVHAHENIYMEGSEHKSSPHHGLRYVREKNRKIILESLD